MNEQDLNSALLVAQDKIRPVVESWASEQSNSLNAAWARADFECAVLDALCGGVEWQYHTNSDLCFALGHTTLAVYVETM